MKDPEGHSRLHQQSIRYNGRQSTMRLEPEMWEALRSVAKRERCRMEDIFTHIANHKPDDAPLASATRVFLMEYYRADCTEEGHAAAGHGKLIERRGKWYARRAA